MLNLTQDGLPACTTKIDFSKQINASNLKDQSILVTGGASGIGKAFVEALASAGAYVTVVDIQDEVGNAIERDARGEGQNVQFVQADVCSWDDQLKAFETAMSFSPHKSLDIVIACAGVPGQHILGWLNGPTSPDGRPMRPDPKCIDINLTGLWYTTHLALHYFRQSLNKETRSVESKQLVLISSIAGYVNHVYQTDYSGAKWGVRGLWRNIADSPGLLGENAKAKFRTSLLAPWFVRSAMSNRLIPILDQFNIKYAETDVAVDVLLRILCDEEVVGRAIAVCPDGRSFDLCDDFDGLDAGREFQNQMLDGAFGSSHLELRPFYDHWKNMVIEQGKEKAKG